MRSGVFLLILFYSWCVTAQPAWILHKPYAEQLNFIDSSYRKHPTEFAGKLDDLKIWAAAKGDPELSAEFLLFRDKLLLENNSVQNPAVENELLLLSENEAKKKQLYIRADALQLLGYYYWNNKKGNNRSLALEYYLTAYNLYNNFPPETFPRKREYLYTLGNAYYSYEDYRSAINHLKEAEAAKPPYTNQLINSIYTTLGLCFRNREQYDSSDWYFQKIYENAETKGEWNAITGGNIGINFFQEKKYDQAIPLLEHEVAFDISMNNNIRNAAKSLCILSMIYLSRNELDKSENLLLKALEISRHRKFWPEYGLAEPIYSQLYKVNIAKNNLRKAVLYADSDMMAKDSAYAKSNSLNLAKAQEKTEYVQQKFETEKLKGQRAQYELIQYSLIAVIVLLVIIALLFINRQRLKQKKLEAENRNAEIDLDAARMQVEGFKESAREKNRLIEHFTSELEQLKKGEENQAVNEQISQLGRAVIVTDEQWEDFRVSFEKVHKGFFSGLKNKMPELTQSEIRFLALTKLKLTSKEMAVMLGISAATIRTYRFRLRKKFAMDKDNMMTELLEDI